MTQQIESAPKLILHIGSQKTGTTSIQVFLKNNPSLLDDNKINFIRSGRTNIAHNSMLQYIRAGKGQQIGRNIVGEMLRQPDHTHVLSSEMFFRGGIADFFEQHFPENIRANTRVLVYLRRQDKYIEAMYKQKLKNGRFLGSPEAYRRKKGQVNYLSVLERYGNVFGVENIDVRPFERTHFPNGDIIRDVAALLGITNLEDHAIETGTANATLSREVSALLGLMSQSTDVNTREIIRDLIQHRPAGAIRSQDCFDTKTCRQIMETCRDQNEALRQKFRPDLAQLFDESDLDETRAEHAESGEGSADRLENAIRAVVAAAGRVKEKHKPVMTAAE